MCEQDDCVPDWRGADCNGTKDEGVMGKNEFKDRLFDILNDTAELQIQDIVAEDNNDILNVYLRDGSRFTIHVENGGNWIIRGV